MSQDPDSDPTKREGADDAGSVIDTSKMSEGERAALEMAEAAREAHLDARRSFGGGIFMGSPDFGKLHPFPAEPADRRAEGDAFLEKLRAVLAEVDADKIDEEGEIPQPIIDRLAAIGAFGIKVPKEYGGLGLSQTTYARAAMELGKVCGNLTALLSAHQSIGVPQPLIVFGTEEQKKKFLPRVAGGEISAFALTEPGVGSDPAKMATEAVPTHDGEAFLISGRKLWCTNGTRAGVIVVMAKTPPKVIKGKERSQVTAFIVEMDSPGITVAHRCRFMGLKSLYNAVIDFDNVRVPRENIVLAEGKGLKVALTTLNTGRITLPAACTGLARECLRAAAQWSNAREQWGAPIGKHGAIADKIARMAADTFALEAMTMAVAGMVDRDKKGDIRIEAAVAKLWGTERAWAIVDDTMQIRGGRGYETAQSLGARGEEPVPVERWLRDCRINTIFEGSTEIMHLFIAREALDPHLKIGAAAVNSTLPAGVRIKAALKAGLFYAGWYPRQWLPIFGPAIPGHLHPDLKAAMKTARALSRRLARGMFHAMARFGPKLDKQQVLLARFVDVGAEIFAIASAAGYAQHLIDAGERKAEDVAPLVRFFAKSAKLRSAELLRGAWHNADKQGYQLAQRVLESAAKA
ncbi:MAG: acyl-CoA dehydrogenase family protein [Verrucomicrobiales bacterium]